MIFRVFVWSRLLLVRTAVWPRLIPSLSVAITTCRSHERELPAHQVFRALLAFQSQLAMAFSMRLPQRGIMARRGIMASKPSRSLVAGRAVCVARPQQRSSTTQSQQMTPWMLASLASPMLLAAGPAMAAGGSYGILEGRTAALVHPAMEFAILGATIYAGYLGWQWRRTRELGEEIRAMKAAAPAAAADAPAPANPALEAKEKVCRPCSLSPGRLSPPVSTLASAPHNLLVILPVAANVVGNGALEASVLLDLSPNDMNLEAHAYTRCTLAMSQTARMSPPVSRAHFAAHRSARSCWRAASRTSTTCGDHSCWLQAWASPLRAPPTHLCALASCSPDLICTQASTSWYQMHV